MSKFWFIFDTAWTFIMLILIFYNLIMGINNHDAYYLTLGIIDYIALKLNVKNIKDYIDNIYNI